MVPSSSTLSQSSLLNQTMRTALGVALIFASAQIQIPLHPVPITLQTMGVMAIGLLFDRRSANYSVLAYLGLGICGLPMFADFSSGYTHIVGPTGGYMAGFIVAVNVMITCREHLKEESTFALALICLLGTAIIMTLGVSYLSLFIGFQQALAFGLLPFIIPGMVKAGMLTLAVRYVKLRR